MDTVGNILIHIALVVSFYAIVMALLGGKLKQPTWVKSARNAAWVTSALVALSSSLLVACFLTDNFSLRYVYSYSNSTMPVFYKVAALWGGQDGSLLFWCLILCAYMSLMLFTQRKRAHEFLPYVIATLMIIVLFFLVLVVFVANPFDRLPFIAANGKGLNPLLQNYYMVIHPPSLYLGYVGMSIPFAFAMAALISGRLDNAWLLLIRRWTLTAWFFLSVGNLLGASWAYEVLGWGGYWAWDPVENAAFMPWLTATAFLHSVIIQEKRGMLKTWNMVLVILSFLFTMTGTFLTRSGIVSSVHSFGQSNIGPYFLGFLLFSIITSVALIIYRLPALRSQNVLDSFASREAAFLLNNLLFVGSAFAILWGTLFPVLSEWVRGSKITVGPPFFNSVMIPIGLVLLLLTGVGPLVAWRKSSPEQLKRAFLWPVIGALLTSALVLAFISKKPAVVASFSFCTFVLAAIIFEYQQGIRVRRRTLGEDFVTALLRLVASNRRRYGGYVVHVAIVLLFVGFTGAAFKKEAEFQLKPGESAQLSDYKLLFSNLTSTSDAHKETVFANIQVFKNEKPYLVMQPARIFYRSLVDGEPAQPNTEVSIERSLKEDLYLVLLSFDPQSQTIFLKAVVNPLTQWIWLGGLCLILGTILVMWPTTAIAAAGALAKAAVWAVVLGAAASFYAPVARAEPLTEGAISKKLVCQCKCGFPDLASCSCSEWAIPAKAEIRARIARGEDEATILKYFVGRDGEKVLTTPIPQGFNRAAWIIPIVALAAGLGVVGLVLVRWRKRNEETEAEEAPPSIAKDDKYRKMIDEELYGTSPPDSTV